MLLFEPRRVLLVETRDRQTLLLQRAADLEVTVSDSWDLEALAASFRLGPDPAQPDSSTNAHQSGVP